MTQKKIRNIFSERLCELPRCNNGGYKALLENEGSRIRRERCLLLSGLRVYISVESYVLYSDIIVCKRISL